MPQAGLFGWAAVCGGHLSPLASVSLGGSCISLPSPFPSSPSTGCTRTQLPFFNAACGFRSTMISTKEKNKSPKASMTLLPCFYFVEVRGLCVSGSRPEACTASPWEPHSEGQGRAQLESTSVRAQPACLEAEVRGVVLCSTSRRSRRSRVWRQLGHMQGVCWMRNAVLSSSS